MMLALSRTMAGIGIMGTYGALEGLTKKSVQGKPLKLRLNAVMNGSGLRGAKAGNGLGALSARTHLYR